MFSTQKQNDQASNEKKKRREKKATLKGIV